LAEEARRLHHHLDSQLLPRQARRVALGEDLYVVAIRNQPLGRGAPPPPETAVVCVVLEEVGHNLPVSHVVDRDDVDPVRIVLAYRAVDLPADPSEAVDADSDRHRCCSFSAVRPPPFASPPPSSPTGAARPR